MTFGAIGGRGSFFQVACGTGFDRVGRVIVHALTARAKLRREILAACYSSDVIAVSQQARHVGLKAGLQSERAVGRTC
jgi:hypothetical protein